MKALPAPGPDEQTAQSAQPDRATKGARLAEKSRPQKFVEAYLRGMSGAAAAREAGYAESTAGRRAVALLERPEIKARIDRYAQASSVRATEIVQHLSAMAVFDPSVFGPECYERDGGRRVVNWAYIRAQGLGPFIREVGASGKEGHETIRWYSRLDALDRLAKIMGLTRDRVELALVDMRSATDEELERLASS